MNERDNRPSLIQQALDARKQKELETSSIEAATKQTPEFYQRVSKFFDTAYGERDTDELRPHIIDCPIPTEEGEIKVTITEKAGDIFVDYEIDVQYLDHVLVVSEYRGVYRGVLHSKEHAHRPFDRNTVVGSSSDLGPVWSRPMNEETLGNYSELMDAIQGPTTVTNQRGIARG